MYESAGLKFSMKRKALKYMIGIVALVLAIALFSCKKEKLIKLEQPSGW